MTRMTQRLNALALCAMAIGSAHAQEFHSAQGKRSESLSEAAAKAVQVRLISESDGLVPGKAGVIGLTFDIAPGWHLYWHNPGDSGLPISWELDAPKALSVGEAMWPAPDRSISAGEILDYTYSDRVTILLPVELAPDHPVGGDLRIRAKVSWLVCREGCVPGGAEVELTIPVAAQSAAGQEAGRFSEARKRLPMSYTTFEQAGGRVAWTDRMLHINLHQAESLEFYPYASDSARMINPIRDGAAQGPQLDIEYKLIGDTQPPLQAVLRVNRGGGDWYYLVEVPPPTR